MTTHETVFAGFGGQGILSMGKFLAYAGMNAGRNVSFLPSYGPEMRGGTANCSVIVTPDTIASPVVTHPTSLVVMNRPSFDKFEDVLCTGGLLILDDDLVSRPCRRSDIEVIRIPAQTLANALGSTKAANMILLGTLVEKTGVVSTSNLLDALASHGKKEFFELNQLAVRKGVELARKSSGANLLA